jgi:hypothetical protein
VAHNILTSLTSCYRIVTRCRTAVKLHTLHNDLWNSAHQDWNCLFSLLCPRSNVEIGTSLITIKIKYNVFVNSSSRPTGQLPFQDPTFHPEQESVLLLSNASTSSAPAKKTLLLTYLSSCNQPPFSFAARDNLGLSMPFSLSYSATRLCTHYFTHLQPLPILVYYDQLIVHCLLRETPRPARQLYSCFEGLKLLPDVHLRRCS